MSDLLYHILGYGAAFTFHTRHALPIYLNTFAKPNRIPLLLHISAGFIEVFKYQILAMRGTVFPDTWDLILCLYHSLSSIYMTKTLRRGNIGTRPAYQVVALWRLCLSTAAWAKHDPHLHWASVRIINSFVYTRVIIYLAYKARFDRRFSGGDLYAAGVFFAGLISIWEIGLFCGLPLFLAHIAGQMWLIDYISVKFNTARKAGNPTINTLYLWLIRLGVAHLNIIKEVDHPKELDVKVQDSFIDDETKL